MTRRLLNFYQYAFPVVLTPLGYWLWLRHYAGDHRMAALALGVPVAFAYIVPGIGTNVLKVWEFDVRLRLGRFRPHHGFVFGSMTAMLTLPGFAFESATHGPARILASGFITASVLGFWNWLYDIVAIHAGILKVYNQPWAEGKPASAIATDYAPIFFGVFGFVYGAGLPWARGLLSAGGGWAETLAVFTVLLGLSIAAPVGVYLIWSKWMHGRNGLLPARGKTGEKGETS